MMTKRVYNFGAGPAMLPLPVLEAAQDELLNWQGLGVSVMEVGHRTTVFQDLMAQLEADFREVMAIPDDYQVLFLGGAARTQFAMVPLNLLNEQQQAAYLVSGIWSSLAFDEAARLNKAVCLASTANDEFRRVPESASWQIAADTAYVYYTPNETINGTRFRELPKVAGVPLVADMTSCILSEPVSVQDYGLIFAGAQKNIAIAGLTIVIIHDALLEKIPDKPIPTMLDYRVHAQNHSLYATPPTFNCYLAQKMLAWVKAQGGVQALYQKNCQKAALLYNYIDASSLYQAPVEKPYRSLMNVCFSMVDARLEADFIKEAARCGLYALKGHRTVGGLRASLYNAMPMAGVVALIEFMQAFAKSKGF